MSGGTTPAMEPQGKTRVANRAALLVNLGSPDSPSEADVRRYLDEFLMDGRVLDTPWPLRRFIVSALILPKRPKETAHAYQKIWRPDGSPLIAISREVRRLVQELTEIPVGLAMRYGNPSIESGLRELLRKAGREVREVYLIPLYPHYAMSSFETVVVLARKILRKLNPGVSLAVRPPFYNDPAYIRALVAAAQLHLRQPYDHLLFSYHGIPERHLRKSDPTRSHCLASPDCCSKDSPAHATCYRHQAYETTKAFAREADLAEGKYSVSFQSRLGRDPWLKPYTDFEFDRLARAGVRRLAVICPSFVSDCLETLEEIAIRGRESFLSAGGEELRYIPCMNDHRPWIEALAGWIEAWVKSSQQAVIN